MGEPDKRDGRQAVPDQRQETSELVERKGLDWASISALGAVVASLTYVLLNSAYLEFYESLGVRPEDVGIDRLAILGRAAGLVLVALLVYAGFFGLLVLTPFYRHVMNVLQRRYWRASRFSRIRWRLILPSMAGLAVCLLVVWVVNASTNASSRRAELTEKGIPVGPVRAGPLLLIDVSADAARTHWLDKAVPRPVLLEDPWLLYLGSNNRVTVFVACGTTVIVPATKVVPEVLTTRDRRQALRGSEKARSNFCNKVKS